MASEGTPAVRRLAEFVRALAEMMPDATNAAMVIEEDAKEEATIREIVAEYFGGKIADDKDARDAMAEAVAVLEGKEGPSIELKGSRLGGLISELVKERREALVALNRIHALAKGRSASQLSAELPADVSPATVLVDVNEAITNAALGRGWSIGRGAA